ncbi:hypothetical protein KVR01_005507 [Diaporthe batatas]|uniref:uncharacterized protein n=1 Tax=Diaporthe batatas TaxID=748121 RepID=UPI001D052B73|nr:uncharacterized protein KVR01_005507 [Diaporthe batatas]KAG8165232.1 hypothetical protein KVR01_005507 [Diaporthe batatas]
MGSNTVTLNSIPHLVEELTLLASKITNKSLAGSVSREDRNRFVALTEKLGIAARDPEENVYYAACRTAQNSAIRCAIGLGIFTIIGENGATTEEISSACGADNLLIERLMRALVSCNTFEQIMGSSSDGDNDADDKTMVQTCRFAHNDLSRCFLKESNRDMFQQMYEFVGRGVYSMADYLEKTGWKSPEGYQDSAISFALGLTKETGGFWEYLAASPDRQRLFNSGMQSRPSVNLVAGLYPFDTELNQPPLQEDEVAVVDVGGGRGHALLEIAETFPGLGGRLVLQDQESVIKEAGVNDLLNKKIEAQAASFFEPNPVIGARAYYFRRIFHDWSDPIAIQILHNTVMAMGLRSRILIADIEVPTSGVPWSMALQDWNMMALGGIERTQSQWKALLRKSGLVLVKVWRLKGSNHVIIEGRRPLE